MSVKLTEARAGEPSRINLSEFFSLVPPAGWEAQASFDHLPVRLMAYGKLLFQPPAVSDVFLKWQIANWLDGQDEWDIFENLLLERGRPDADDLKRLYSLLLRIPIDHVADYSVTVMTGLGAVLIIDYHLQGLGYKGRVMYVPSPTGPCDVQVVSYEGQEPDFSLYLIDALSALESCRQTGPLLTPLPQFILPRASLSFM